MNPARYEVAISNAAERDLRRIAQYIADARSLDEALAPVDKVTEKIDSLEQFPERGAVPKEVRELGIGEYRQALIQPYRIFYWIEGRTVTIVMIADGRRDIESLLQERLIGK